MLLRVSVDPLLEAGLANAEIGRTFLDERTAAEEKCARTVRAHRNAWREFQGSAKKVLRQKFNAAKIGAIERRSLLALAQGIGELLQRDRPNSRVFRFEMNIVSAE